MPGIALEDAGKGEVHAVELAASTTSVDSGNVDLGHHTYLARVDDDFGVAAVARVVRLGIGFRGDFVTHAKLTHRLLPLYVRAGAAMCGYQKLAETKSSASSSLS